MAGTAEHYESLLADIYTWLYGGAAARREDNRVFFAEKGITPRGSGRAVDLGCGSGFQSIPLSEAGFTVTAIDQSEKLLAELEAGRGKLPIAAVKADILEVDRIVQGTIELAVCMGDTLTHLASPEAVEELLRKTFKLLEPGGRLVLTFRNLTAEVPVADRFIPVRSDDDRLFSCFLDYEGDYVTVHDILYTRTPQGWELKKSFYRKLRIPPQWVMRQLESIGFRTATLREERDLATIIAEK